jgi:putative ABC transport system ATP-binding protein
MKVFKKQTILIIATSALDANSEYLVNDALQKVMRSDSTTLTIAHRLATIRRADLIIVLSSEGEVAEKGTYLELTKKPNGAFNKLMQMQMEGLAGPPKDHGVIYEEAEMEEKEEQALKEAEEARLEQEKELSEGKEKES